jgi:hypothetical protein
VRVRPRVLPAWLLTVSVSQRKRASQVTIPTGCQSSSKRIVPRSSAAPLTLSASSCAKRDDLGIDAGEREVEAVGGAVDQLLEVGRADDMCASEIDRILRLDASANT